MYCQTCGAQLTDAICPKCAAPKGKTRAEIVVYTVLAILALLALLLVVGVIHFLCCGLGGIS